MKVDLTLMLLMLLAEGQPLLDLIAEFTTLAEGIVTALTPRLH